MEEPAPSQPTDDTEVRMSDAAADGRNETENQRLDRNWNEILQEFRVTQTGTQILTGFLLTLPFQQRFAQLDRSHLWIYLTLVVLAVMTTAVSLAPVSLHRTLFRMGAKGRIVRIANRLLRITLALLALVLTGTMLFIFDLIIGPVAGVVAAASTLVVVVALWIALPIGVRGRRPGKGR